MKMQSSHGPCSQHIPVNNHCWRQDYKRALFSQTTHAWDDIWVPFGYLAEFCLVVVGLEESVLSLCKNHGGCPFKLGRLDYFEGENLLNIEFLKFPYGNNSYKRRWVSEVSIGKELNFVFGVTNLSEVSFWHGKEQFKHLMCVMRYSV